MEPNPGTKEDSAGSAKAAGSQSQSQSKTKRHGSKDDETAKRRMALRDFYKLQQQQQQQQPHQKEDDDDTSWFDGTLMDGEGLPISADAVDEYIQKLVKTSDLKHLLHTENQLLSLIRGLDSEQKALVYNNYNKLITTSNTLDKHMNNARELTVLNDLSINLKEVSDILSKQNIPLQSDTEARTETTSSETEFLIRRQVKWLLQSESSIRRLLDSRELVAAKKHAEQSIKLVDLWQTKIDSPKLASLKQIFESLCEEAQNKIDFASSS